MTTEPALRLEGSLGDVSLDKLLDPCREHMFTGAITVRSGDRLGELALNGGIVDEAKFGDQTGDAAVTALKALKDGKFKVVPRLPDLAFGGKSVKLEGTIKDAPLAAIMRHAEENALSCTVLVETAAEKGEIKYKMGEIVDVRRNGVKDEDWIAELVGLAGATLAVRAAGLEFSVPGATSVTAAAAAPAAVPVVAKVEQITAPMTAEPKKAEPVAVAPVAAAPVAAVEKKAEPVAAKAEPKAADKKSDKKKDKKKEPVVEAAPAKKAEPVATPVATPTAVVAKPAPAPAPAHAAASAPTPAHNGEHASGFSFMPLVIAAIVTTILTYLIVELLF